MRMKFDKWLDEERGRLATVARHFDLTQSAVHQWRTAGVPVRRMKAVHLLTGGAVGLDEMLPDDLVSVGQGRAAAEARQ